MARLVNPTEARKGRFLASFDDVSDMREFINAVESSIPVLPINGEIVYSYMTSVHCWQVFILPLSPPI